MEPGQFFSLQWNQHKGTIVSTFEKFFEKNAFVDCTLAAEGQYLNVHKMILTACSPYFEVLLSQNHDKHPIIILKDMTFKELKAIVDYMYRGIANVSSTEMKDFLAAADSLQIKGLGNNSEKLNRGEGVDDKMEFVGPQRLPTGHMEISSAVVQGERSNLRSSPPTLDHTVSQNATLFESEFGRDIKSAPQHAKSSECPQGVDFEETWLKTEPFGETSLNENTNSMTSPLIEGMHSVELIQSATNAIENMPLASSMPTTPSAMPSSSTTRTHMDVSPKREPQAAIEEAETASVSSIIELSDTSDECGEIDMDDEATPGGLWHSSQNTIAYESEVSFSQQDGGSDVTQPSLASVEQDTENAPPDSETDISEEMKCISSKNSPSQTHQISSSNSSLHNAAGKRLVEAKLEPKDIPSHQMEKPSGSQCEICCLPRPHFKGHTRSHAQEKDKACKMCKALTRVDSQRRRKRTAKKTRPHTCGGSISVKIPRSQQRQLHKERPFCCSLCGADFSSIDILSYHLRTHTREKPHGCELCTAACCSSFGKTACPENRIHMGERLFQCTDNSMHPLQAIVLRSKGLVVRSPKGRLRGSGHSRRPSN